MKRICLDAGHGPPGSGAVHNGVDEAVYVLAMQYRLAHALALAGIQAAFTRTGPEQPDFFTRAKVAHESGAGGIIVLHVNSDVPLTHGPMAFHRGVDVRAMDAAQTFVASLNRPGEYSDGLNVNPMLHQVWVAADDGWRARAYACMRYHTEPVMLAEMGYCSNPDEARWLLSEAGQVEIVAALVKAAEALLG